MLGLGALGGAALGGLGSLFGGGQQGPDAQTKRIRSGIYHSAQNAANGPQYQGLLGGYGGFSGLTNLGVGALGGDQAALSQFMNPYIQNVIDKSNAQFGQLGNQAQNQVSDRFTQAGAFGGSRAAVAGGVAASQLANQQALANSQLYAGGFQNAQQAAAQAAQLGMQGNQGYLNALGAPSSWLAQALPGGTTSQGGGGIGGFFSGALGGGILGSQMFPGGGAQPAPSQGQTYSPGIQGGFNNNTHLPVPGYTPGENYTPGIQGGFGRPVNRLGF